MSDEITLVVPASEDFHHIALLVMGGLGARLDLTYEDLDDLQTALDALLGCRDDDGDITVTIVVAADELRAAVGPFEGTQLDALESESAELGLRRVLETVADGFEVERRGGAEWVMLTKRTSARAGATG